MIIVINHIRVQKVKNTTLDGFIAIHLALYVVKDTDFLDQA